MRRGNYRGAVSCAERSKNKPGRRILQPILMAAVAATVSSRLTFATPTVQMLSDSGGNYDLVNNGTISFKIYTSGSNEAKVTSIKYGGQEMVGSKGLYYDIQGTPNIYYGGSSVFHVAGDRFELCDLERHQSSRNPAPINTTLYWIIRDGDPGFSTYESYDHPASLANWPSTENRFAEFFNSSLFNYSSISDQFWGYQSAGDAIQANGRFITGETTDMRGIPSEYIKNYETKYDWRTTFQNSGNVTGLVTAANTSAATRVLIPSSENFGVWNITNSRTNESWNAGPTQPQSPWADGQSFIVTPAACALGGPGLLYTGDMEKGFGPYFTYFNTGSTINSMLRRCHRGVQRHERDREHRSIPSMIRLRRSCQIMSLRRDAVPSPEACGPATAPPWPAPPIILSTFDPIAYAADPIGQEYQRRAAGYNYWVTPNADGTFNLADVRPGTYRVTVIKPGYYREGTFDNITVTAGGTTNVGNLTWSPDINGKGVLQIGTFDRTAGEFRNGKNYNNWIDTFNRAPRNSPTASITPSIPQIPSTTPRTGPRTGASTRSTVHSISGRSTSISPLCPPPIPP